MPQDSLSLKMRVGILQRTGIIFSTNLLDLEKFYLNMITLYLSETHVNRTTQYYIDGQGAYGLYLKKLKHKIYENRVIENIFMLLL